MDDFDRPRGTGVRVRGLGERESGPENRSRSDRGNGVSDGEVRWET